MIKGHTELRLEARTFSLLKLLIENRERAVTVDEILAAVWNETSVDRNSVYVAVSRLRIALGQTQSEPYIKTIARIGFQFVARVDLVSGDVWKMSSSPTIPGEAARFSVALSPRDDNRRTSSRRPEIESSKQSMSELEVRFVTELIRPWDLLNHDLCEQKAIQPDISDFTRRAAALAVAIKHFAENQGQDYKEFASRSESYRVMSDVADGYKHGQLAKSSRNNKLYVASQFEVQNIGKFRFLHNAIIIDHNNNGKMDFLEVSKLAIQFLLNELTPGISWVPVILLAPEVYADDVRLHADTTHQVSWKALQIQFFRRSPTEELTAYDPPRWEFHLTSEF